MEVFSSKQAPSLMKFKDLCTLSRLLLNEDFEEAQELVFRCRKRIEAASPSLFSKEYLDVQRSRRKSKDVKAPEGSRHPSTESPGNMRGGPDANIQEQVDKKKENIQGHESIVHGIVDEIISNAIEEAETSEADEMVDILLSLVMENAKEPGGWREASEKTAGEKADAEKVKRNGDREQMDNCDAGKSEVRLF